MGVGAFVEGEGGGGCGWGEVSLGADVQTGDGSFGMRGFGNSRSRECSSVGLIIKAILLTAIHACIKVQFH